MTTTPKTTSTPANAQDDLSRRAGRLGLYGLLAQWDQIAAEPWIPRLLDIEENEQGRRSLERRIRNAKLGRFKPMADFDWTWPKEIDHELIEDLFRFEFVAEAVNLTFRMSEIWFLGVY